MNNIFDGIQRPLEDIAKEAKGIPFIPRGLQVPILNMAKEWEFKPTVKVGDKIGPGCIYGTVVENEFITDHKIMLPPDSISGRVKFIEESGNWDLNRSLIEVESDESGGIVKL